MALEIKELVVRANVGPPKEKDDKKEKKKGCCGDKDKKDAARQAAEMVSDFFKYENER